MKNITKALGIVGIAGASFLPLKSEGQEKSMEEYFAVGKKLDTLQTLATNYFNLAKISYNTCVFENHMKVPASCFEILIENLNKSEEALENYVSIFEKNKVYEDKGVKITHGRDLNPDEAKEWIKNEGLILEYITNFLKNLSKETEEKFVNQIDYTTKQTHSYFPQEGMLDFSDILDK